MALIKSISGIRGTIGGVPGESLSPLDIVRFAAAYGSWLLKSSNGNKKVVIGRDGRISGEMVQSLVVNTLLALGIDVIDLGLSTTPTVEMSVVFEKAAGGIILTASHNPKEWNALKLLNHKGEFISGADGAALLEIVNADNYNFASVDQLGTVTKNETALDEHIKAITAHPLVDIAAITASNFSIVVDAINSSGAFAVPQLLRAIGVTQITVINEEVNGRFAHNPEPLPENLRALCSEVLKQNASMGIAVDPDVDRLCFVCEDGTLFGEEYTLVAVADYVLQNKKGNTVSNMSSTRALRDITQKHGGTYTPSAVGEVNVVAKMKATDAVIGGEGNGGIIVQQLRNTYPDYFMSKNKIELTPGFDLEKIFNNLKEKYKNHSINTQDGLKIDFENDWVHLRSSNTEPIIRIYAESNSQNVADNIAQKLMKDIQEAGISTQ